MYAKPRFKSIKLLNTKNYTRIAINLKYIGKISIIRYRKKFEGVTKLKTWWLNSEQGINSKIYYYLIAFIILFKYILYKSY